MLYQFDIHYSLLLRLVGAVILGGIIGLERGITTAAGLWTTACVGIIVGSGYYIIAFTVVIFMMFAMLVLKPLIFRYHQRDIQYLLRVTLHDRICMKRLIDELISEGIEIIKVNFEYDGQKESIEAVAEVRLAHYDKNKNFVSEMSIKDEVLELMLI